jgi:hypothetical protein
MFAATLVIMLFVILPLASVWFGADSRDRAGTSQW